MEILISSVFLTTVADQLDGDEDQHSKYRQMVLDYIEVLYLVN